MIFKRFHYLNEIHLFLRCLQDALNFKITFTNIDYKGLEKRLVNLFEVLALDLIPDFGDVLLVKNCVCWKQSWDEFFWDIYGDDFSVKGVSFWNIDVNWVFTRLDKRRIHKSSFVWTLWHSILVGQIPHNMCLLDLS